MHYRILMVRWWRRARGPSIGAVARDKFLFGLGSVCAVAVRWASGLASFKDACHNRMSAFAWEFDMVEDSIAADEGHRRPGPSEPTELRSKNISFEDGGVQSGNRLYLVTRRCIAQRCAAFSRSQSNGSGLKHAAVAIVVVDTIEASGLTM
jgi:hypothetical protein